MSSNQGKFITIKNALIFDGVSDQLVEGDIRIHDGRIVEVGSKVNADLPIVDAKGSVVSPGLIDNHFHAYGSALNMLELDGRIYHYQECFNF